MKKLLGQIQELASRGDEQVSDLVNAPESIGPYI